MSITSKMWHCSLCGALTSIHLLLTFDPSTPGALVGFTLFTPAWCRSNSYNSQCYSYYCEFFF